MFLSYVRSLHGFRISGIAIKEVAEKLDGPPGEIWGSLQNEKSAQKLALAIL